MGYEVKEEPDSLFAYITDDQKADSILLRVEGDTIEDRELVMILRDKEGEVIAWTSLRVMELMNIIDEFTKYPEN